MAEDEFAQERFGAYGAKRANADANERETGEAEVPSADLVEDDGICNEGKIQNRINNWHVDIPENAIRKGINISFFLSFLLGQRGKQKICHIPYRLGNRHDQGPTEVYLQLLYGRLLHVVAGEVTVITGFLAHALGLSLKDDGAVTLANNAR